MKILLFILLYIFSIESYAQTNVNVYSFKQAGSLFKMFGSLDSLENKSKNLHSEIPSLIENNFGKNNVFSYFIEAFIRETESKDIKDIAQDYLLSLDRTETISAILMRYESSIEKIPNPKGKGEITRYNYKDQYYDENIKFSRINKSNLFNNEIHIFLPKADFTPLYFKQSDSDKNDPNKLLLMAGGQTTAISINATRLAFNQDLVKSEYTDISNIGVVAKNKFDQTFISLKDEKDSFRLELFFINRSKNILYQMTYNYYISSTNMNYKIFKDLKAHLVNISLLTYRN